MASKTTKEKTWTLLNSQIIRLLESNYGEKYESVGFS